MEDTASLPLLAALLTTEPHAPRTAVGAQGSNPSQDHLHTALASCPPTLPSAAPPSSRESSTCMESRIAAHSQNQTHKGESPLFPSLIQDLGSVN